MCVRSVATCVRPRSQCQLSCNGKRDQWFQCLSVDLVDPLVEAVGEGQKEAAGLGPLWELSCYAPKWPWGGLLASQKLQYFTRHPEGVAGERQQALWLF